MVSPYAKYIPLILAVLGDLITFLQNNSTTIPYAALLTTVAVLAYAILHDYETPGSTPVTSGPAASGLADIASLAFLVFIVIVIVIVLWKFF